MAGEGHTWHENQLVPITRHGRREDVYWTYSYGPIDDPGAIERAGTFAADVVLLDVGLPEMNGYEVARRLRAEGSQSALVALTGYGRDEDVQRARDAGFDAHVTKPVALADLERILEEHGGR